MEQHLLAYYVGIFTVFATHAAMYVTMPEMKTHALINLAAAALIAYYFLNATGYIAF